MARQPELTDAEDAACKAELEALKVRLGSARAVGVALGYPATSAQQTISNALKTRVGANMLRRLREYQERGSVSAPEATKPATGDDQLDLVLSERRWVPPGLTPIQIDHVIEAAKAERALLRNPQFITADAWEARLTELARTETGRAPKVAASTAVKGDLRGGAGDLPRFPRRTRS